MTRKIALVVFNVLTCSSFAMESDPSDMQQKKATAWKLWVQAASSVTIQLLNQQRFDLTIANDTTIGDINEAISNRDGIPTDQQSLHALVSSARTFWSTNRCGFPLADRCLVKEVMNAYDTNLLLLRLENELRLESKSDSPM